MNDTVADNNRVKTADRLARIETKLDAQNSKLDAAILEGKNERKGHSRRLDQLELALAKLEMGERERERIEDKADKALVEIESLKKEQRVWTGVVTVLSALGASDGTVKFLAQLFNR